MAYFRERWAYMHLVILNIICLKNDILKTLDDILLAVDPNSYAFSVHSPALLKRQEEF